LFAYKTNTIVRLR